MSKASNADMHIYRAVLCQSLWVMLLDKLLRGGNCKFLILGLIPYGFWVTGMKRLHIYGLFWSTVSEAISWHCWGRWVTPSASLSLLVMQVSVFWSCFWEKYILIRDEQHMIRGIYWLFNSVFSALMYPRNSQVSFLIGTSFMQFVRAMFAFFGLVTRSE